MGLAVRTVSTASKGVLARGPVVPLRFTRCYTSYARYRRYESSFRYVRYASDSLYVVVLVNLCSLFLSL